MSNLTLENRLVRPLGRPRPEPGHHVVVYREDGEGRTYHQTLPRGEAFRPPLLDRFLGSFVGYAVQAGEGLRHEFDDQLETGTGDERDTFIIHVTLLYRVGAPELLVERLSEDPLGRLEREVRSVFRRRASDLTYAELVDQTFDLEGFLLRGGDRGADTAATANLGRFQALARDYGLDLERLEVTRDFSTRKKAVDIGVVDARDTARVESAKVWGRHQVEATRIHSETELAELRTHIDHIRAAAQRQNKVFDAMADGLKAIVDNVSADTRSVSDVRKLLGELNRARQEFDALVAPARTLPPPSSRGALGPVDSDSGLGRELRRLLEVVASLHLEPRHRAGLEGQLLRVVAEVRLAGDAADGRLEEYAAELRRYSEAIGLEAAVSTEEQRRYLVRFQDAGTIRRELAALSVFPETAETEAP